MARRTLHADGAAHQRYQPCANRQAQPAATILACGAGLDLIKRLKQRLLTFWRYADAGIAHAEFNQRSGVRCRFLTHCDSDENFALVGELDCIGDEIHQHLTQPRDIAVYPWWHFAVDQVE